MTDAGQTITLLFADLGETAVAQDANPDTAALLRQAMEAQGGQVFKTVGDLHCVVFARPEAALAAALAAQRAVAAGPWDTSRPPCVRIALHRGEAIARGGDYFGPPLNQVARLLHAAHPGQTLVTETVLQALGPDTPPDIAWRDLGRHRLRDVQEPVRIYQADPTGLAQAFPPLATEEFDPNNLPAQLTAFIGRETELAALRALLEQSRLLTLTGPGGVGKTRLALQLAAEARGCFADGRFFVALGLINDPALVPGAIAAALDLTAPGSGAAAAIAGFLQAKELLLVLDNFEHVSAAAPVVSELLTAAPRLTVLVTSRQPLRLSGEQEFAVPLLGVPARVDAGPEEIGRIDAVRLFINRARASRTQFALTAENAPALAGICQRLDGLPLAIELAAARSKRIPPERMLDQLDDRLGFLNQGSRDLPPRQQALRTAIDWSYDLLAPAQQQLFQRLAIFVGGFTLEAAEAILADPARENDEFFDILDGISTLVDNSLLQVATAPDGHPRYTMLQTIHAYARERLDESGERARYAPRHAAWYRQLALEARTHSRTADELLWLKRIQSEMDNLRGALTWLEQHGSANDHLQLVSALWWFWLLRPDATEGRALLRHALARPDGLGSPARADALAGAGALASMQGDLREAAALMDQSIPLMRASGDRRGLIRTLINASILARQQHDLARANDLLREALELVQGSEDKRALGAIYLNLGEIAVDRGEYEAARGFYVRAYQAHEAMGDQGGMAYAVGQQAELALSINDFGEATDRFQQSLAMYRDLEAPISTGANLLGLGQIAARTDLARATGLIEEALTIFRDAESRDGVALARMALAEVKLAQADPAGARALLTQSLAYFAPDDDPMPALACFVRLAEVAVASNDAERAARLLGAAVALRAMSPVMLTPRERQQTGQAQNAACAALGQAGFAAAYAAGETLSFAGAAMLAREIAGIPTER